MFRLFGNGSSYKEDKVDRGYIHLAMARISEFVNFCKNHNAAGSFYHVLESTSNFGTAFTSESCYLYEIEGMDASTRFHLIEDECRRIKSQASPNNAIADAYNAFSEYFGGYKAGLFGDVTEGGYKIDNGTVVVTRMAYIKPPATWKDTRAALIEKIKTEYPNIRINENEKDFVSIDIL